MFNPLYLLLGWVLCFLVSILGSSMLMLLQDAHAPRLLTAVLDWADGFLGWLTFLSIPTAVLVIRFQDKELKREVRGTIFHKGYDVRHGMYYCLIELAGIEDDGCNIRVPVDSYQWKAHTLEERVTVDLLVGRYIGIESYDLNENRDRRREQIIRPRPLQTA